MDTVIGIDTGGTYTDAVIWDPRTKKVLAEGKAPTTHGDLAAGIGNALDTLPAELLRQAKTCALSTTLATNACVENKGGRARLVMMGTTRKTLEWIGSERAYGLPPDEILCLDTRGSYDGSVVEHPDWDRVIAENDAFLSGAEALGVVELNAMRNGGVCETDGCAALRSRYGVPVIEATGLAPGLNMMKRGATALLNARLLPVAERFILAVDRALTDRGLDVRRAIVRSDGSLMAEGPALERPVDTILSGPAASVIGCTALAGCGDAMIVDMGGTTTDISILRGGAPQMTGGIRIGSWRTQVRGVFIDTFALGGDTRVFEKDRVLTLDVRRVEPICSAAARWPRIREELAAYLAGTHTQAGSQHEFLCLLREPEHPERYDPAELRIVDALRDGPQRLGGKVLDRWQTDSERLEREGVVLRCGFTPTDVMHIRGDYSVFDAEASRLAARCLLRALPGMQDDPDGMRALCDRVYDFVGRRMFENVARVFIETSYPEICADGIGPQLEALIARRWDHRGEPDDDGFFALRMCPKAALVGVGAPVHLFLPEVARALGAQCVIPDHSGVANAVGAAAAGITARVSVEIRFGVASDGSVGYTVHAPGRVESFEEFEPALETANRIAKELAAAEARRLGASGELSVTLEAASDTASDRYGSAVDLGTTVTATAGELPQA